VHRGQRSWKQLLTPKAPTRASTGTPCALRTLLAR
jgi:hypothetical protein